LSIRAARIAIDACLALAAVGDPERARSLGKRGLKILQGQASDGLGLEVLLALQAASPDVRVLVAAGQVAERIAASLSPALAAGFSKRPAVAQALAQASRPP
jgi:hypothetical protein